MQQISTLKKITLLVLSLFLINTLAAQKLYKAMIEDLSINFYDVCKEADDYFTTHGKGKGSGWKGYQRWKNANESTYYPSGRRDNIDPLFVENEYKQFLRKNPKAVVNSGDKGLFNNGWNNLGPSTVNTITGGYSAGLGRVEDFYVDPNNANTIYLGSRSGGFWKTTNGGTTWQGGATDFLSASGVDAIAVNPSNTNNVLINLKNSRNGYSHGIYQSVDGGNTFALSNFSPANVGFGGLGSNFTIYDIAYHPTIANLVFVGTSRGLYRSTDNLATWTRTYTSYDVDDIKFHPTDANIVYFLDTYYWGDNRDNILYSTDMGVTFTLSADIPGNGIRTKGYLDVSADCANCVYFASSDGVFKSIDSGLTFSFIINPGNSCSGGFAVNDTDDDNMIYGYLDTERTTDGGTTFNQVTWWSLGSAENGSGDNEANFNTSNAYVHADLREAECVSGVFYVATDGFLCKSTDNGATWAYLSQGTGIRENYKLGTSQSNHYRTVCGSQDNGTSIKQNGNWIEFYGADGMEGLIHPLNDDWIVASLQYGGRRRTKDGGQTQDGVSPSGQSGSGNGAWEAPILYDPNNQMRLYNFSKSVYVSEDFGSSWVAKGSPVTFTDPIDQAAIAENNSDIIVISTDEFIEKSTDAGATFTSIQAGLPTSSIQDIAFDPNDDDVIIVVYASYQNDGNKVFKTTNGGASWVNITHNLGDMPIRSVVIDHSAASNIYLGAEIGVYTMPMSSSNWSLYNTNLPNMTVEELEINYGSNTLKAATWGRGLWEYTLVGRNDYPAILATEITNQPTDETPKATVGQYVTSTISYSGTPSDVHVEWSVGTPTFGIGNTIVMVNTGGQIWVSSSPIPDQVTGTKVFFKVFATGAGNTSETYKFMYTVKPFEYCTATGHADDGNLFIENVTIANINKDSGNDGYTLYNDVVNLARGGTYAIAVESNTSWSSNDFGAWIDFNRNAVFEASESLNLTETTGSLAEANFTVPMNADIDQNTRLRVRLSYWGSTPEACNTTFGELEDYPVAVAALLPVELINFQAKAINNESIQLTWQTASEINNDYFTIENSKDGKSWRAIAEVNGAGNATTLSSYQANDKNPFIGRSYYRLKQTDFDGNYTLSTIKTVNITDNSMINIYPNPTNGQLTIVGNKNELEAIEIFNVLGQNMNAAMLIVENTATQQVFDLSKLATGMYTIKTKTKVHKVYKQ